METDPESSQPPSEQGAAGRSTTVDGLVGSLRAKQLTVLIGPAGSGKTRLLRDGVLSQLRRRSEDGLAAGPSPEGSHGVAGAERRRRGVRPRELVVHCDRWDGPPAERVHACLDEAAGVPPTDPDLRPLPVALRAKALSAERGTRLLFVFDDGERLAAAPCPGADGAAEYDALVNALCSVSPSVHLLLGAREDALPPSMQSRLGSPDTDVVRLPAATADSRAVAEGPSERQPRALHPMPERPAVAAAPALPAAPEADAAGKAAAAATVAPSAAAPETLSDPATSRASAPAPFPRPGAFVPAPAARRRRARGAVLALAAFVALGIGFDLWHEQRPADALPEAAERLAAPTNRALPPVTPAERSPAAVQTRDLPSNATGIASRPAAIAAEAASSPLPDTPPAVAAVGQAGGDLLADQLWHEMARHGVDPAVLGHRLALLPYDAVRALAASRSAARVVAPLFTEEMMVLVRADSPLAALHEIADRRVAFGPVPSARHDTAVAFYRRLFDRPPVEAPTNGADLAAAVTDLLDGHAIDAIVLPDPQPSTRLAGLPAAQRQRLRLLGAAADDPSTRQALRSYLPAAVRPPSGPVGPPVRSFSVMTFLVAYPSASTGRDDTGAVAARALCASLPELRRSGHPKWREVDPGLQLPVPLARDPEALAIGRACDAGRPAIAAADSDNDPPPRGDRQ